MDLALLLDMAAEGAPDRVLVGSRASGMTADDLRGRALAGARLIKARGASSLIFISTAGPAFPLGLFAAAIAGVPFLPLNYRLPADQLAWMVDANQPALVVADDRHPGECLSVADWLSLTAERPADSADPERDTDPEAVAVLLYTSGTTARPKAAVLRHRHLASYVIGTVEYGSADSAEAALISVPPYHIAGVSNVTSNIYAGRRLVFLPSFDPATWLKTVREEEITHSLLVPTMLARIVEHIGPSGSAEVPSLRVLAYGGARMPHTVIERALGIFPDVGFVNAYGLTETSSTVALLDPAAHREAMTSDNPAMRARLGSAGRPVPGVEIQIRDVDGEPCPPGKRGELWVRGEQVAGEYREAGARLDAAGWFDTRDRAWLDSEGFLFIEGRADDTIIRGGENIAPEEIEEVLLDHPAIRECAVVGVPDQEWGQRIAAAIVPDPGVSVDIEQVRVWARARLRGSRMPDLMVLVPDLPQTATGKLIRRQVIEQLAQVAGARARNTAD